MPFWLNSTKENTVQTAVIKIVDGLMTHRYLLNLKHVASLALAKYSH